MTFTPPPSLTPTARLILNALRSARAPLTLTNLINETGASSVTVSRTTQQLVRDGHLVRIKIRKYSYFTLATEVQK